MSHREQCRADVAIDHPEQICGREARMAWFPDDETQAASCVVGMEVLHELARAMTKHPTGMRSAHEAYAVILEELDEVKAEVWKRTYDPATLRKELVQVAAMAIRAIVNLKL